MSDLVDRQQAIDIATFECGKWKGLAREIAKQINALPSVQPEQAVKDCRNCKHGKYNDHLETHFCYNPNECTEWNLWEPIAQPERKRGKWIYHSDWEADGECGYECSECGMGSDVD